MVESLPAIEWQCRTCQQSALSCNLSLVGHKLVTGWSHDATRLNFKSGALHCLLHSLEVTSDQTGVSSQLRRSKWCRTILPRKTVSTRMPLRSTLKAGIKSSLQTSGKSGKAAQPASSRDELGRRRTRGSSTLAKMTPTRARAAETSLARQKA